MRDYDRLNKLIGRMTKDDGSNVPIPDELAKFHEYLVEARHNDWDGWNDKDLAVLDAMAADVICFMDGSYPIRPDTAEFRIITGERAGSLDADEKLGVITDVLSEIGVNIADGNIFNDLGSDGVVLIVKVRSNAVAVAMSSALTIAGADFQVRRNVT